MDSKSFIFLEAYFRGAMELPPGIRREVYDAIITYAFTGEILTDISATAKGVFTMVQPLIDTTCAHQAAGRKGGRPRKAKAPEPEPTPEPDPEPPKEEPPKAPSLQLTYIPPANAITIEEAVERMRADTAWVDIVCKNRGLYRSNIDYLLTRFLAHYQETRHGIPHNSFSEARKHFLNWLTIQQNQTSHARQQPAQHNSSTLEQRNAEFASHIADRLTRPAPDIDISGNY